MIYKLYANDPRFRKIILTSGMNIILADRDSEATDKDSRNGLGKSTFIYLVHFCLGADLDNKKLPIDTIQDWAFYLEMDLFGEKITIKRQISEPNV